MASLMLTSWTRGSEEVPLYSDWKVSFITDCNNGSNVYGKVQDAGSVSTSPLSFSDDSVVTNSSSASDQSSHDNNDGLVVGASSTSPSSSQEPEQQEATFSVHRNMIGPKSVFFTKSFLGQQNSKPTASQESNNNTASVISLPSNLPPNAFAAVVEAFEALLDYCYTGNLDLKHQLTTENAVAMFCLCIYFGMDSDVCNKVRNFIKSDLNQDTVAKYYQIVKDLRSQAFLTTTSEDNNDDVKKPASFTTPVLNANPIMNMVVIMCHQFPNVLDSTTELSKIADLSLWLSIGSLLAHDDDADTDGADDPDDVINTVDMKNSKVWSENLTNFFDCYNEEDNNALDLKDSFCILTAEKILPIISEKVALQLLEYERKHGLSVPVPKSSKNKENDDDDTIDTTYDSDLDDDDDGDTIVSQSMRVTNLQQRCIKALCDSNWTGEQNDVEEKKGKLTKITTPAVLEALLIKSVAGGRALGAKTKDIEFMLETEKQLRMQEKEVSEYQQDQIKVELAKEQQKQQHLQKVLEEEANKREAVERMLNQFETKAEVEKKKFSKANAILEAKLEGERKKSKGLDLRYRAMEAARSKTEADREMFEMTCKETIQRLEVMNNMDEWWNSCGMGPIVMMLSTMSDRKECDQIKAMLQRVINDPSAYERDYMLKNGFNDDGDDSTVLTTSRDKDDDCTVDEY